KRPSPKKPPSLQPNAPVHAPSDHTVVARNRTPNRRHCPGTSTPWRTMTHPRPHTATAITLALALALFASACSTASEGSDTETSPAISDASENWLADYDLDGLDGREITEYLDAMPVADRPEELIASVEPEMLVLYDTSGNETTVP